MTILVSVAASRALANAAAVATAMAGGTTTAEATAIANLLLVLARRNDLMQNSSALLSQTDQAQISPG
jgi:hypothetical protein